MMEEREAVQAEDGTVVAEAVRAARNGVALMDRSGWGRIRVGGSTRHRFLHNMTTSNVNALKPGDQQTSVLVTATARVIDLVTLLAEDDAILIVSSPERREIIPGWLQRFVFFNDDVSITDVTAETALLTLVGPGSAALLAALGFLGEALTSERWTQATWNGNAVMLWRSDALGLPTYNLLVDRTAAEALRAALAEAGEGQGLQTLDEAGWEALRVAQGFPRADRELTEEHNPLEGGLWHAVNFAKGCYIGQEIIARLDTYQKVKQRLMGVRLETVVAPGTVLAVNGEAVGTLTSVTPTEDGAFGLAYVRAKAATSGQAVLVGDAPGELVEAPALTWGRTDIPSSPVRSVNS